MHWLAATFDSITWKQGKHDFPAASAYDADNQVEASSDKQIHDA